MILSKSPLLTYVLRPRIFAGVKIGTDSNVNLALLSKPNFLFRVTKQARLFVAGGVDDFALHFCAGRHGISHIYSNRVSLSLCREFGKIGV